MNTPNNIPIHFSPEFTIPHFLLVVGRQGKDSTHSLVGKTEYSEFKSGSIKMSVEFSGMNPQPCFVENANAVGFVLGSPIYKDVKIDLAGTGMALLKDFSARTAIEEIDGEFLAFSFTRLDGRLKIINDRFTSVPLYYYNSPEKNIFCASPYFYDIWNFLKKNDLLKLNNEAFFEFLWFQRIFGTKTLAEGVPFLQDAHIMEVSDFKTSLARYWRRNYSKNRNKFETNAHLLADFVRESVKLKSGDGKKYGHFLSGGMDSRSVLAAFSGNLPACFTVGVSDNREVQTARKIAQAKGAEHYYLELDQEHYGKIREASTNLCGGMYNYDHAIFLGYNDAVRSRAEVCFNGYGFDFMFQGMYIPARNLKIGNHVLYLRKMIELPDNLVDYFIQNASYRIKDADIMSFVRDDRKKSLESYLHESINEIYENGRKLTGDKNDLWEYLTFHHVSRHYSYPNVIALSSFCEARIISFTNDIFNLYLTLPTSQRFNGAIEKELLKILDPKLARIRSANTNLPVTATPLEQTLFQLANAAKRRILCEKDYEEWTQRTWPSREVALRNNKSLKNAALDIINSNVLEQLDFLDLGKIRSEFPNWLDGKKVPGISGDLVQTIVTMGTFLKNA